MMIQDAGHRVVEGMMGFVAVVDFAPLGQPDTSVALADVAFQTDADIAFVAVVADDGAENVLRGQGRLAVWLVSIDSVVALMSGVLQTKPVVGAADSEIPLSLRMHSGAKCFVVEGENEGYNSCLHLLLILDQPIDTSWVA